MIEAGFLIELVVGSFIVWEIRQLRHAMRDLFERVIRLEERTPR